MEEETARNWNTIPLSSSLWSSHYTDWAIMAYPWQCCSSDDGLSDRRGQGAHPPGGKGVYCGAKHTPVPTAAYPVGGGLGSEPVGKTARAAPAWQELRGETHI